MESASFELNNNEVRLAQLLLDIARGTEELFQRALGVAPGSIVTLRDAQGLVHGAVLVKELRARQLTNGTAVFSVGGPGQPLPPEVTPAPDALRTSSFGLLLAAESEGKFLHLESGPCG
jgi:hypothetical protein